MYLGLRAPCALEMYSKALIVVPFPCGPRMFGVLDGSLCIVLCNFFPGFKYIFCMGLDSRIYIPRLSCMSTRLFFVKITNCIYFSLPWPSFFVLRFTGCSYCCFPACWVLLMCFMFVIITLCSLFFCTFVWLFFGVVS